VHRTAARCVELLLRAGPLSAGELSAKLGLSPSGTTPLLDRLEEAGTIRRVRPEGDRRRITIELTADGRAVAQGVWDDLYEPLAQLASEYERSDLELVQGFLRRANAILGGGDGTDEVSEHPAQDSAPVVDPPLREPAPKERAIFRSRWPSRPANRLR
jgi:DNA-binding MarR family transcriptional regulator